MRISVTRGDAAYVDPGHTMDGVHVLLDGRAVQHVVMADEEAGEVEALLTSDDGQIIVGIDGMPVPVRLGGRVEIVTSGPVTRGDLLGLGARP